MPDMYMDVDAALSEVPVNIMPLIDDTDFKTRETAIAFNAAGMDLVWNFVTSAGAYTQTAVTPTSGGDYDWAHQGDGMYSIEIPASGGASINNDTEGYGWFTGLVTGVLPWRGPVIGFRASGINDKLLDSAYDTTRGLAGTALPGAAAEAAGGLYTRGSGAGQLNQQANGQHDVNVERLLNVAQSATDLKDFADDGYDPATNKVQGVVLVDTLTTYTGNTVQTGDSFARIGVNGAGLTNIDLPNQTMDIVGNITGNLSGSVGSVTGAVGSVTGAVGSVTGNVGGNVNGNVVGSVGSVVAGVTLAAAAVQAIWDALTAALTTANSIGKLLVDNINATVSSRASAAQATAIQADTDDIQTRLPAALVGGRMDSNIGAVTAGVIAAASFAAGALDAVWSTAVRVLTAGTNIVLAKGVGVTGFNDVSAAQVNAEVVDVMNVDTYGETSGVPGATDTIINKLSRLYDGLINKLDVTASKKKFYNNSDVAQWEKDLSDDGVTYNETKGNAP